MTTKVEFQMAGRQILGDRQRAHHETGLEGLHGSACPRNEISDSTVPPLLADLVAD
jgi:hypothetical protein